MSGIKTPSSILNNILRATPPLILNCVSAKGFNNGKPRFLNLSLAESKPAFWKSSIYLVSKSLTSLSTTLCSLVEPNAEITLAANTAGLFKVTLTISTIGSPFVSVIIYFFRYSKSSSAFHRASNPLSSLSFISFKKSVIISPKSSLNV